MAKGKMRIGYAVMTKKGNLLFHKRGPYAIYKTKKMAKDYAFIHEDIVRVTIDTDD